MTVYEKIQAMKKRKVDFEIEIEELEDQKDDIEYRLEYAESEKKAVDKNIETLEEQLLPSDPEYRLYWATELTDAVRTGLEGQFKYGEQYSICNGFAIAVINEPIEGVPFSEGKECLQRVFDGLNLIPIDFKASDIAGLEIKYGTVRIGRALINSRFLKSVAAILQLDDTAKFYNFVCMKANKYYITTYGVEIRCENGEKALILGIREDKE